MTASSVVAGLLAQAGTQPGPRRIDLLLSRLDEPLIFALVLGILLGLFLLAIEVVTLVYVWIRSRNDRHRERHRPAVRDGLFERLAADDPDWTGWIASLDETERELLRDEVDSFLRKLDGTERRHLRDAGRALGIPSEAMAAVRDGTRHERLLGLKWLTVLDQPVETTFVRAHCQRDPTVRAAAARLLYETDHADAPRVGTELLLSRPDRPMTSFGVDTLYRLHEGDPTALFEYAADHVDEWSTTVTLQVLLVLREFAMLPADAPTAWLLALFDHESPDVRAATARAFVHYGWREDIREQVPRAELIADAAPTVRRAVCEMLGSWSDEAGIWELKSMAVSDPSSRVRVAAMRELTDRQALGPTDPRLPDAEIDTALQWVLADRKIADGRKP
ncbi:HEAT repeat domain-containing protein [Haloarcula salinisoli]|uniref:HEAT repeat domain-containing protein n=1 Tax=Haloarcula salinisoli TaxID=2487746 RepID=A0A8J7YIN7_9EURY|nr:HEAT repeat domain-containing protein [Halomicroarcula salinisoli]MBX0285921.1 HEAT repeat domain-containing protein [Halomicroarcula salinisoli]MBX0302586.1 HEAT repeat domain-containing protein [Halomicroarcula salinisoli]